MAAVSEATKEATKEASELKSKLELGLKIPKQNTLSRLTFIFTPFASPHGFTRRLQFNRDSILRNNEVFSTKAIQKISEDLLNQAQAKFKRLPKPVLTEILRVVMFSDDVTLDGHGPLPANIWCIPRVFIQHHNQRFYFDKGTTKKAFTFLTHAIHALETPKEKELHDKKFKADCKHFEEETFQLVQNEPHFLTAYGLHAKGFKPLSQEKYWKRECQFILGFDVNATVNEVREGRHRFFGSKRD